MAASLVKAGNIGQQQGDVRQLCHILAALNYDGQQTLVMPESFARPNFDLVCDILTWFARIVDDKYALTMASEVARGFMFISSSSSSPKLSEAPESSRVAFLVDLAKLFASQLGVQLDLISLYRADETSCAELLKLAEPIYKAAQLAVGESATGGNKLVRLNESQVTKKLANLATTMKKALDLIGTTAAEAAAPKDGRDDEIGELAATELIRRRPDSLAMETSELIGQLEQLLAEEEGFNEKRKQVMERRLELADIEQVLRNAHDGIVSKTRELAQANNELEKDLERLDERLGFKEMEVNGARERLNDLLIQAPTYVHQYERLRNQYELAYENWVSKYRSLMYLKSCVYLSTTAAQTQQPITRASGVVAYDELTKPGGSSAAVSAAPSFRGGATAAATGELAAGLGPGSGTTGPARLLESLFEGTSNPMSTSAALGDSGVAMGPSATGAGGGGLGRGADAAGAAAAAAAAGAAGGLARYDWRPAVAGDATGLELEGLLNEFVADEDAAVDEEEGAADEDEEAGLAIDSDDEGASTDDEGPDDEDGEEEEEEEEEEDEVDDDVDIGGRAPAELNVGRMRS